MLYFATKKIEKLTEKSIINYYLIEIISIIDKLFFEVKKKYNV